MVDKNINSIYIKDNSITIINKSKITFNYFFLLL
jgi:hypothetical protein